MYACVLINFLGKNCTSKKLSDEEEQPNGACVAGLISLCFLHREVILSLPDSLFYCMCVCCVCMRRVHMFVCVCMYMCLTFVFMSLDCECGSGASFVGQDWALCPGCRHSPHSLGCLAAGSLYTGGGDREGGGDWLGGGCSGCGQVMSLCLSRQNLPKADLLPPVLLSSGLSLQRLWYMYLYEIFGHQVLSCKRFRFTSGESDISLKKITPGCSAEK